MTPSPSSGLKWYSPPLAGFPRPPKSYQADFAKLPVVRSPNLWKDLLISLVRTPSPTGDCERALQELCHWLTRAGIPYRRLESRGVAPVLLAGALTKRPLPTFLFATHLDTVSPSGSARDPPPGTVTGGTLHGRGALDMKSGLAVAIDLLSEFSQDPRFQLGLVVTTDEEAHSAGAHAVLRHLPRPPDLVLVPEPTWENVALSASGRIVWIAGLRGPGGHAQEWRASRRAPNPLLSAARFLGRLPSPYVPLHVETRGDSEVTLPREVWVRIDRVLPPGASVKKDRDELIALLRNAVKRRAGLRPFVTPETRETPWPEPYRTDPQDPWVRRFLAAARQELPRVHRIHERAVGDFNVFGALFPTVLFGPMGSGAHGEKERVRLPSVARCHAVYRRFLLDTPPPVIRPSPKSPDGRSVRRGRGGA